MKTSTSRWLPIGIDKGGLVMIKIGPGNSFDQQMLIAFDLIPFKIQSRCIKIIDVVTPVIRIRVLYLKITGPATDSDLSTSNAQILFRIRTEVILVNLLQGKRKSTYQHIHQDQYDTKSLHLMMQKYRRI